jgi:hypothetical protein
VRRLLLASLAVVLTVPVGAQAGPAPLIALQLAQQTAARLGTTLAGPEPLTSANVELVATVPGTFIGMQKVGNRLIATGTDGLSVFDITDPTLPRLTGVLPLAHFENEDVSADDRLAVISNDRLTGSRGGLLYVVDLTTTVPTLASTLDLDVKTGERGPGHVANCVGAGPRPCTTLWLTGGHRVWVADLKDPKAPKLLGAFDSPASMGSTGFGTPGKLRTGATHDAERDSSGTIWVTGSGGAFGYRLGNDPLRPTLLTGTGKQGVEPGVNDFVLHNSKRLDTSTLLVTEEDYVDTSEDQPGSCHGQGKFQTWDVRGTSTTRPLRLLDQWQTEVTGTPLLSGNKAPVTANCSSHWFSVNGTTAAVGWYEQGLRLLDVRNPRDVKQVGYWLPPDAVTWAATWITKDLVYTADVGRGIDVLRVSPSGKRVAAPIRASWLGAGPRSELMAPSRTWKWVCSTASMPQMPH